MKKEFNIWWKLTPIAAILTVASWVGWFYVKDHRPDWPLWMRFSLLICIFLPNMYLSIFALWHWRTRYKGRWHPFAWAVAFVLWWTYLPALGYFLGEILPDMRGKGAYATPPEYPDDPPSLLKQYQYVKSVCYILGWVLLAWAFYASVTIAFAHWMMIDLFVDKLPEGVPKDISANMAKILVAFFTAQKTSFAIVGIAGICSTVGAILLCISQRMRWRLLDEKEKSEIKKGT